MWYFDKCRLRRACEASFYRVPTRQGKVMEIQFFFKVREKSGNSVKLSGKLENLQKSGKSQGILKSCLANPSKIEQIEMTLIVLG